MCRLAADANPRNNGLGLINAINKGCQHYLSDEDYDTTTRNLSALDALNVAKLKIRAAVLRCTERRAHTTSKPFPDISCTACDTFSRKPPVGGVAAITFVPRSKVQAS